MGDRANVKIVQHSNKPDRAENIYLYTHWGGHDLPQSLQCAMEFARGRWTDESYFTRCLITEICKSATDATGFGVSTYPTDNEHDILEVDAEAQKVRLLSREGYFDESKDWEKECRKVLAELTFEEFVALPLSYSSETPFHVLDTLVRSKEKATE